MSYIYLIGSLRNEKIIEISNALRHGTGLYIHDDWWSAGREADDYWRDHQKAKGLSYKEALAGPAAQFVFSFDMTYLTHAAAVVMAMPCGKSGHLEFGFARGMGKPGWILFEEEPERFDVMTNFANDIFFNTDELIGAINEWSAASGSSGETTKTPNRSGSVVLFPKSLERSGSDQ